MTPLATPLPPPGSVVYARLQTANPPGGVKPRPVVVIGHQIETLPNGAKIGSLVICEITSTSSRHDPVHGRADLELPDPNLRIDEPEVKKTMGLTNDRPSVVKPLEQHRLRWTRENFPPPPPHLMDASEIARSGAEPALGRITQRVAVAVARTIARAQERREPVQQLAITNMKAMIDAFDHFRATFPPRKIEGLRQIEAARTRRASMNER